MQLTSLWTTVVLAVLALAAPVAAIMFWNRLPSRPGVAWPARGAMLLAVQLTACLLVGGLLNDYGQFYPTWSDLFGSGNHQSVPRVDPPQLPAYIAEQLRVGRRIGASAVVSLPTPVAGGRYSTKALVYLPAAYFRAGYRNRFFPVIEIFDGYPGSPRTWVNTLHLQQLADREIAAGRVQPFIGVMPTQNYLGPGHDGECLNVPGGAQVETTLTANVRNAVLHAFRASRAAANWALMGYSTGGYCAVNLAMRHPSWYATAVSISGYTHPFQDGQTGPIFRGRPAFRHANDPLWRLQHLPAPGISVLFVATKPDRAPYSDALIFARYVRPPLVMSEMLLPHGGHNFVLVSNTVPSCLDWISSHIGAPTAPAMQVDRRVPHVVTPRHDVRGTVMNRSA